MPDITPPALQLQNVGKRVEKKAVLQNVNLTINKGEFFGLIGMNGAGKTTLIKCLLDFCALDRGSIEIFGIDHRLSEARGQIAYLPERFAPPYYLTGRNFIQYMLALQAVPYCADEVECVLRAIDLEPAALTQPVRSYSKGMTQKLGLAACFLGQNNLYILDEPMSGLDPKARILLKTYFRQLRTAGCTLFFSSHALADVIEICDRMAILYKGELRFIGSPAQCCERYAAESLEQAYMNCIEE